LKTGVLHQGKINNLHGGGTGIGVGKGKIHDAAEFVRIGNKKGATVLPPRGNSLAPGKIRFPQPKGKRLRNTKRQGGKRGKKIEFLVGV